LARAPKKIGFGKFRIDFYGCPGSYSSIRVALAGPSENEFGYPLKPKDKKKDWFDEIPSVLLISPQYPLRTIKPGTF